MADHLVGRLVLLTHEQLGGEPGEETLEVCGFVDPGRLGVADRHADLSLLLASAQDTWPDEARHLRDQLEPLYGSPVDADRLRFHLFLDPLTWD